MASFVSSTDANTLKIEGNDRNHFLSLIVNNAGTYTAAITRKVVVTSTGTENVSYDSFNNEKVSIEGQSFSLTKECIEYFMLDIEKPEENNNEELESRIEALRNTVTNTWFNREYSYNKFISQEEPDTPKFFSQNDNTKNKDIVKSIVAQLITGNVFAKYNPNLDLNKWTTNMVKLYDKEFKSVDSRDFDYYITSMLDMIYTNNHLTNLPYVEGKELTDNIIKELNKYPTNPYLEYFKQVIEEWI